MPGRRLFFPGEKKKKTVGKGIGLQTGVRAADKGCQAGTDLRVGGGGFFKDSGRGAVGVQGIALAKKEGKTKCARLWPRLPSPINWGEGKRTGKRGVVPLCLKRPSGKEKGGGDAMRCSQQGGGDLN